MLLCPGEDLKKKKVPAKFGTGTRQIKRPSNLCETYT